MRRLASIGALVALFVLGLGGAALANHTFSTELHRVTLAIGTQTSVFTVTDRDPIAHNTTTITDTVTVTTTVTGTEPPPTEPPPPSSGFPDASNTGPTGALTSSTGNISVTVAGTIIENRLINGCVSIAANNVTIRNSHIRCFNSYGIQHWNGNTGLLVEDTIVEGGASSGTCVSTTSPITVRRSEVFGCENLIWVEQDALVEDNYLHDPEPYDPATDPHTDGVQMPTPTVNVTIRHNTIYGGYLSQQNFGNSAITTGTSTDVLIENNLLAGGGYTLRCPLPVFPVTEFQWHDNRFSRILVDTVGGFGPVAGCDPFPHSGNVIHETGEPVG